MMTLSNDYKHLQLYQDQQHILWLGLDVANKSTNILIPEVLTEMTLACEQIQQHHTHIKGIVLYSKKTNGFIAGADIERFKNNINHERLEQEAFTYIQQGQQTCQHIADLSLPSVAMIDGFCMGGGTEIALACDYIIVSDNKKTQIALPEIKLGIHPGFGGTVRAIERLGVLKAMPMMLTGKAYNGYAAKKLGLADAYLPLRQLKNTAIHLINQRPAKKMQSLASRFLQKTPLRQLVAYKIRQQTEKKVNPTHYPAPFALIRLWKKYGNKPIQMYQHEAHSVAHLITTETAQNLVRVFFLQTRLKAQGKKSQLNLQRIHIIGGGVMGGDIAAWCAMQGFRVTLQDMHHDTLAKVIQKAHTNISKTLKNNSIAIRDSLDRLIADKEGNGIAKADVIIEAIFENLIAKQQLFKTIEKKARSNALLATNTSSIPLTDIAQVLQNPQRLIGLHFFNPVFKMPLLEIVYNTDYANEQRLLMIQAHAFARHINKLPLAVKSNAGFLINRLLVPYLLEAILLHQQGCPASLIDQAATDFGMPVGPLELADTIGLDICLHVGNILSETLDLEIPNSLIEKVDKQQLGKKTGQGFYYYPQGKRTRKTKKTINNSVLYTLQDQLLSKLVNEAEKCLQDGIVADADLLDAGVIWGTGFAPFRGGVIHYSQQSKRICKIEKEIVQER